MFSSTFTEIDDHLAENQFSITVIRAKIKMIKLRIWITILIFVNIQWIWGLIHTLLYFRLRFNLIKTAIHRKIINYRRHNGIQCAIGCITIISWTLVHEHRLRSIFFCNRWFSIWSQYTHIFKFIYITFKLNTRFYWLGASAATYDLLINSYDLFTSAWIFPIVRTWWVWVLRGKQRENWNIT